MCLAGLPAQTPENGSQLLALIAQGESALQKGDLRGAETLFRRATATDPRSSDAYFGLGLVQLKERSLDGAVDSLGRAATLNPRLEGPHLFLGIAQFQAGQGPAAVVSLQQELALDPNSAEALRWTGIAQMSIGRPEEACAALDRLATLKPNDPQVLYARAKAHSQVAEASLADLVKLDPDSALVHRATAENFDSLNQPDRAVAEYQAALQKQPNDAELLEALGDEEQKVSHFPEAREAYQRELTLDPHSVVALYALGKIDVEQGQPAEGVVSLRQAWQNHASPGPTAFYLGLGLAEIGQNDEAAHWLEESLKHEPSLFVQQGAWYQLARVYGRLNRRAEAQDALAHLKVVLAAQDRAKEVTAKAARAQTPSGPQPASGIP